jgi:hypothetical protein
VNEIRWEDPPPSRLGRNQNAELEEFRAKLIANPGVWAVCRQTASDKDTGLRNSATNIRHSESGWRGYRWDATVRRIDGTSTLYVRCLGPVDGDS